MNDLKGRNEGVEKKGGIPIPVFEDRRREGQIGIGRFVMNAPFLTIKMKKTKREMRVE